MQSRHPYQLMAGIVVALALSFAAGALSASPYPTAAAESDSAEKLVSDLLGTAPFEYFPHQYQNQAAEIEPLPPQF
jgi:hypothetical protein